MPNPQPSQSDSRARAIAALAKVRNDSNDCACDGCLVDAVLGAVGDSFEWNWYDLFKASGLPLDETRGDGVGRFTPQDKAKIVAALSVRADAIEAA